MSEKSNASDLPRHAKAEPGAEIEMTPREDGGVTVSFSDGSDDLDVSRREFMRITGVAAATAVMASAGCRDPKQNIVPYVDRPEEVRMGESNTYATVCSGCATQCGVLVETRAGRPIKVEGNPDHPVSRGSTCARGQASYRKLYDPDRQRQPLRVRQNDRHEELDWETVDREIENAISSAADGGGIGILTTTQTGSAQQALIDQITSEVSGARHYTYEPLNSQAVIEAAEIGFGEANVPHYRFDRADLIVSLGSDFLGTWLSPVEFTRQFSTRRDPDGDMNRLVAFEGSMTVTGANADDRHRVRYSDLVYVALGLANHVAANKSAVPSAIKRAVSPFAPADVAERTGLSASALEDLGDELLANTGSSLVVAGGVASSTEEGIALETAVNLLNVLLENEGRTVERDRPSRQIQGGFGDLQRLIEDVDAGRLDVLIIDRTNPVYSAPRNIGIAEAIEAVPLAVSTSDRVDETAVYTDYLATGNHDLESWGDSNPFEGVYSVRQPTIRPMYNTRAFEQSLILWFGRSGVIDELGEYAVTPEVYEEITDEAGKFEESQVPGNVADPDPGAWYRYLRDHWREEIFPKADSFADFDSFWQAILRDGVFEVEVDRDAPEADLEAMADALPGSLPEGGPTDDAGDLSNKELHLFASIPMYDGRLANDGHLQELPDPISKHTWGSYVLVSPSTFREADLELGEFIEISVEVGDQTLTREFPVIMQPGLHDDVVAVPLGYGRTRAGVVGSDLGANAFEFSQVSGSRQLLSGIAASLEPTGESEDLAIPQGSHVIDPHERPWLASTTLDEYREDAHAGIHQHSPLPDLWEDHDYGDLKWGMSIDMSKCTGCSACVTACQEENNVPVVGRQGVVEGREMHWLRIDRYYELPHSKEEYKEAREGFVGDPMFDDHPYVGFSEFMDNPRVLMQPMLCQHCENAPCETVCPVLATMHSSDGLNQMAYNRCVGTRYCSNNCPYKVRRFNWYNYATDRSDGFLARLFPEMEEHADLNVKEPLPLSFNPDVTVRSRGVMEKCTFCVQRIRRAKWQAKAENRGLREGDVVTACQQVCPAEAIEFGNLMDEDDQVAQDHADERALRPLAEIGTESSIAYLTRVYNTEADHS
ncbi:MAG: 4Fe-4S dicluster domain-containing protein [Persicimonas sp.]